MDMYASKTIIECQDAFAGKPGSYRGLCTSIKVRSAIRPPSLASQLPQRIGYTRSSEGDMAE
jgi:hypothetical protein